MLVLQTFIRGELILAVGVGFSCTARSTGVSGWGGPTSTTRSGIGSDRTHCHTGTPAATDRNYPLTRTYSLEWARSLAKPPPLDFT